MKGWTITQQFASMLFLYWSWYTNRLQIVGNVELEVMRSRSIWLFSTNLGRTWGDELATDMEGNELKGMFENEGSAKHTCVDSGS